MQILYRDRFEMLPIVIGALGYIPKCLLSHMEDLGFEKKEAKRHINKIQGIVTNGTVKICKNVSEVLDSQKYLDYFSLLIKFYLLIRGLL